MKLAALTLDERGSILSDRLRTRFPRLDELRNGRDGTVGDIFRRAFKDYEGLVCIMASGIVVRMIAPLAVSKLEDPAVVVLDDAARWAISLLSGHEGGANRLAYEVAAATGAEPVVSTGSETVRKATLGVGCRKGVSAEQVESAVAEALAEAGLMATDIRCAASIRLKDREPGLIDAFRRMDIPLQFIGEERINTFDGPYERGGAAERNLGVRAVAEPCALLIGRRSRILLPKRAKDGVTVAIGMEE